MATAASTADVRPVIPVIAATERATTTGCFSGWDACPFSADADPAGTELFQRMRTGVSEAWAQGSLRSYTGAWNAFVAFCTSRVPPLCPLPATPTAVALFLFFRLTTGAQSFSVIKTASAAIHQAHVANLLASPTDHQLPSLVRKLAKKKLGTEAKNVKSPFDWAVIAKFASDFARAGQPPVRQMLAVLAAVAFAGFCRPDEVAQLRWRNVVFCNTHATITLERRKNRIYRESRVRIASNPAQPCCPASLLRWWCSIRMGTHFPERPVFPAFDGDQSEDYETTTTSHRLSVRQRRGQEQQP